jgi:hypothetical protein
MANGFNLDTWILKHCEVALTKTDKTIYMEDIKNFINGEIDLSTIPIACGWNAIRHTLVLDMLIRMQSVLDQYLGDDVLRSNITDQTLSGLEEATKHALNDLIASRKESNNFLPTKMVIYPLTMSIDSGNSNLNITEGIPLPLTYTQSGVTYTDDDNSGAQALYTQLDSLNAGNITVKAVQNQLQPNAIDLTIYYMGNALTTLVDTGTQSST